MFTLELQSVVLYRILPQSYVNYVPIETIESEWNILIEYHQLELFATPMIVPPVGKKQISRTIMGLQKTKLQTYNLLSICQ